MDHRPGAEAFFSPSGERVVLFDTSTSPRGWNSLDGTPISASLRHDGLVTGAMFDRSERRLLSWSDGTARLWDLADSQPVVPPMDHPGPVFVARFSNDGSFILTSSADGEARRWNVGGAGSTTVSPEQDRVVGAIQDGAEERIALLHLATTPTGVLH